MGASSSCFAVVHRSAEFSWHHHSGRVEHLRNPAFGPIVAALSATRGSQECETLPTISRNTCISRPVVVLANAGYRVWNFDLPLHDSALGIFVCDRGNSSRRRGTNRNLAGYGTNRFGYLLWAGRLVVGIEFTNEPDGPSRSGRVLVRAKLYDGGSSSGTCAPESTSCRPVSETATSHRRIRRA